MIDLLRAIKKAGRWTETTVIEDAFAYYSGSTDPNLLKRRDWVIRFLARASTAAAAPVSTASTPELADPKTQAPGATGSGTDKAPAKKHTKNPGK